MREQQLVDTQEAGALPADRPLPDAGESLVAAEEAAVERREIGNGGAVHLLIRPSGDRGKPGPRG